MRSLGAAAAKTSRSDAEVTQRGRRHKPLGFAEYHFLCLAVAPQLYLLTIQALTTKWSSYRCLAARLSFRL